MNFWRGKTSAWRKRRRRRRSRTSNAPRPGRTKGQAVPSDLLSAQVQLAQAQEDLLQAQNAVDLAHAALNVAMGLPEDAATAIEPGLKESSFDAGALADRQQHALKSRPDLREAGLGVERAANGQRHGPRRVPAQGERLQLLGRG